MNNNNNQLGDREYLPFDFNEETVYPEDYLLYCRIREEEIWYQYFIEIEDEKV